jgi:gliding motility-associated-like protein
VCFDGTAYTATATAPAGSSIIYYTTETGSTTTSAPTATAAGIYTAWAAAIDDITACESERTLVTLTINELPAAPTPNNVTACFDGSTYTATASAPAGASVVYYTTELGGVVTTAPSASAVGNYTAWAASQDDLSGCESDRVEVTLVINELPDGPTANNVINCFDGTEYTATATAPAGSSVVYYTAETDGSLTTAPAATNPGTYTAWAASVDDVSGCESIRTEVTLIVHPLPEGTITYGATNFCPVGTITPTLTNNVTIVFTGFAVDPNTGLDIDIDTGVINLAGSVPGDYLIEYRFMDENFCLNTASTNITINDQPTITIVASTDAVCAEETAGTGTITVLASSGVAPFTYELLDSDLNVIDLITTSSDLEQTFTGLLTGTYYVRVADDNSCESAISEAVLIDEPDPIAVDPLSVNLFDVTCNGEGDGIISLTANGGSGILEYSLVLDGIVIAGPQAGNAYFANLEPGAYTISIVDEAGCSIISEEYTIVEPTELLLTAAANPDIVCEIDEATIEASASQGTGPYSITLWLEGLQVAGPVVAGEDEIVLYENITTPGTYTVMVTDANSCEETMDVIISEPLLIIAYNVDVVGSNSYCDGGTGVEIILDGSEAGVNYQLLLDGSATGSPVSGTGNTISFGLQTVEGNYTVTAAHETLGCTADMTGSVDVVISPLPLVFDVSGGGDICEGDAGVEIGLSGSETGVDYLLYLDGVDTGVLVVGDDNAITFGTFDQPGVYSVVAINQLTLCESPMNGSTTITIQSLPIVYNVTGGGSFCQGGAGVEVGLDDSDTGIEYQLIINGVDAGAPVVGLDGPLSFGLQTLPGIYTVSATNTSTACTTMMNGNATVGVNSLPLTYNVTGGGSYCDGESGLEIGLDGSETGISYYLLLDGTQTGDILPGTGNVISFGLQTDAGIYTVQAETDATGCEQMMDDQAEVIILTLPAVPLANNVEVCFDGTEYVAGATSEAGTSLVWYADGAGTAPGAAPVATNPGTYTAWVSAVDDVTGCESALVEVTLIINELPDLPVANNLEVCFDNNEYSATANAPDGSSVVWYMNETGALVSDVPTATDPGTYQAWAASVDNVTGCESDRVLVTLVINPLPDAPVASDLEVCFDGTEYSASAMVNTGESLVWYTAETGSELAEAPAGTDPGEYTAWAAAIDDVTGCESERTLVTLTINALPEATISYGNTVFCPEGIVSVAITTEASIDSGIFSADPAGLDIAENGDIDLANSASGTYLITYTFTDSNGCTNSTSLEISVGEGPSLVDTTPTDAVCAGEASGSISAEATGGLLPYTFELLDSDLNILSTLTSETGESVLFEGLFFGAYQIRVTDANSCGSTLSETILVDEPDPITIDPVSFVVENISCNGLTDGRISLTANGGSGQLSYNLYLDGAQFMGPETGIANFTGLNAGTYYVVISDEAGCSVTTEEIIITEPASMTVNATVDIDLVCPGDEATIEVTVNEGTAPYAITLWFDGAQIDGPLNANEGEAVVFSLLTDPGTYSVIVEDVNGCDVSTDVTVSEPTEIMVFNVTTTGDGSYCQDGEGIEILLDGSETGVSYQLLFEGNPMGDPVAGTGEAVSFGLVTEAGSYEVTASHDIAGCELPMAGSVPVSILPLPQVFEVSGGGTICEGEAGVEIVLNGSEPDVSYSLILDGAETGVAVAGDGTALSFGLHNIAGDYTINAVNNITGCTSDMIGSASIIVNPLPVPVISATADEVCEGATVTLTASGGDTYMWTSDPVYDFEGNETSESIEVILFESTTFYLEATNGCGAVSTELTINVVPAPVVDLGEDISSCEGEVVTLDAGEFTDVSYLWSDGSTEQTLDVMESGTYSVTVTSLSTSCVSSGEVTVTFHSLPLALVAEDQSVCLGDQVFIGVDDSTPVPANSYLWTSDPIDPSLTDNTISNPEVSPLVTTTYTLTETYEATGCVNTASVTITVVELTADAGEDQTICGGQTAVLGPESVDEELLYSWSSSDQGEQFDFNVPNPEVTPFETTTYTLTIEHATLGCLGTDDVTITVQPQPLADAGIDYDICIGEEVELGGVSTGPIPANTYLWTSEPEDPSLTDPTISNPSVSPQVTTTYTLTETYVLTGCSNQNSITVTVHDFPQANVIADRDVCADEVINLGTGTDEPGFTYSWTSSPSGFFSSEANPTVIPGLYQLNDQNQIVFSLVVSNGFCTSEASTVITVYPEPVVVVADDMTFCSADEAQNQSIGSVAVAGYSYSWTSNPEGFTSSEANPQVSPTQTTTYILTVTDTQSGCNSTNQVTIVINDLTIVSADNPEICETDSVAILGESVVIVGGVAPYQYFWSDADGNSISSDAEPTVEAPFSESYNLMVMDQLGCFVNATLSVILIESPEVELFIGNMTAGENYAIYPGQTVTFEALPAGYSFYEFYIIDPVEELPDEVPVDEALKSIFAEGNLVQSGEFNTYTTSELLDGQQVYVVVYDAGCPGYSQKVNITLNELPNAFTPDDDGFNDIFGVGAELTIFNRWGQKVFMGTEGWDGTFNGAKVSPGTYYYLMNVYDQENKRTTVKGSVTVVLQQ